MEPWLSEALKSIGPIGLFAYAVVRLILDHKGRLNGNGSAHSDKVRREIADEITRCVEDQGQQTRELVRTLTRIIEEQARAARLEYTPQQWDLNSERIQDIHRIVTGRDEPNPRRRRS